MTAPDRPEVDAETDVVIRAAKRDAEEGEGWALTARLVEVMATDGDARNAVYACGREMFPDAIEMYETWTTFFARVGGRKK